MREYTGNPSGTYNREGRVWQPSANPRETPLFRKFWNGLDVMDRGSITRAPSGHLLQDYQEDFWNTRAAFARKRLQYRQNCRSFSPPPTIWQCAGKWRRRVCWNQRATGGNSESGNDPETLRP